MKKEKISLSDMLNHSKQELIQADSKLGWLLTVHVLLVTTLVTIGGTLTNVWIIVGPVMIVPVISIIIILFGLLPRNKPHGAQGLNPFNYKNSKTRETSADTDYNTTISINLSLARVKYICARNSFWYIAILKWVISKFSKGKKDEQKLNKKSH